MTEFSGGTRAMWNGKEFILRGHLSLPGTRVKPPVFFSEQLPPDTYLDGHLVWEREGERGGRGGENKLSKNNMTESEWNCMLYCVYDTPDHTLREETYMRRLEGVRERVQEQRQKLMADQPPQQQRTHVKVAEGSVCESVDDMYAYLSEVVKKGSKGILLHDPEVPYVPGFPFVWKKEVVIVVPPGWN